MGNLKSQRIDCLEEEVFYTSVVFLLLCNCQYNAFITNRTQIEPNLTQHYIFLSLLEIRVTNSISPTLVIENKASIEGGIIFLAALSTVVNGVINANGNVRLSYFCHIQGCPSGRGLSPGHASKSPNGCAGGGGYGGAGGQGGTEHGGTGGSTYGNKSYPLLMGSGGGSMSQSGGTGGGVIIIHSVVTKILHGGSRNADADITQQYVPMVVQLLQKRAEGDQEAVSSS